MLTADRIAKIKELALADAKRMQDEEGRQHRDLGADDIMKVVRVWTAGLNQRIPNELWKYDDQIEIEADEKYNLYLELKKLYEK